MTNAGIIDIVSIVAVVGLALFGALRGLLKTLAGIAVLIVASAGAWYIASHCAEPVAHLTLPIVEEQITARLEEAMPSGTELSGDDFIRLPQMPELFERFGMKSENIDQLMKQIQEKLNGTGESIRQNLSNYAGMAVHSVQEELLTFFFFRVLLILSFVILSVVLRLLVNLLDQAFDAIPVMNTINTVGGGLIGLTEGVLLLVAVLFLAGFFGYTVERPPLADTHVLRYLSEFLTYLGLIH